MHPYVHWSTIHNSQDIETTQMSIKRWMDLIFLEDLIHIYNGILLNYKKKNKIMPFAATWKQLEILILSEISQKKTNTIRYHLYV